MKSPLLKKPFSLQDFLSNNVVTLLFLVLTSAAIPLSG